MGSWARADGYRAIVFNAVAETNTRAVKLSRSLGFTVLATVPEGCTSCTGPRDGASGHQAEHAGGFAAVEPASWGALEDEVVAVEHAPSGGGGCGVVPA